MSAFDKWFATSPLASFLKIFGAYLLSTAVAAWATTGVISLDQWQTWVIGGLVSAIPVIINWLNPNDARYGRTQGE